MKLKKELIVYFSLSKDSIDLKATTDNIILFLQQGSLEKYQQRIPILNFLDENSVPDNVLLKTLEKVDSYFFRVSQDYILKNCWNSICIFSDAVHFLQIWLKKDPESLLTKLTAGELVTYLKRVEYDKDGDQQCYFPRLLNVFKPVIQQNKMTSAQVLDALFTNFGFSEEDVVEQFIREVIGYNRLEKFINEVPTEFRNLLMERVYAIQQQGIDIGFHSRRFLEKERQSICSYLFRQRQVLDAANPPYLKKVLKIF
jgi:hypothetical protein